MFSIFLDEFPYLAASDFLSNLSMNLPEAHLELDRKLFKARNSMLGRIDVFLFALASLITAATRSLINENSKHNKSHFKSEHFDNEVFTFSPDLSNAQPHTYAVPGD